MKIIGVAWKLLLPDLGATHFNYPQSLKTGKAFRQPTKSFL
jgi:hypothetical protein